MNAPKVKTTAHSADVLMQLHVGGHALAIAQLGPDFLVLRNPTNHPPTHAEIVLAIDGQEKRWAVHLEEGITVGQRKTRISPCSPSVNGSTVD